MGYLIILSEFDVYRTAISLEKAENIIKKLLQDYPPEAIKIYEIGDELEFSYTIKIEGPKYAD